MNETGVEGQGAASLVGPRDGGGSAIRALRRRWGTILPSALVAYSVRSSTTMKVANVCGSSGVSGGRVARPRRDIENEEVQMYLSKLKELVPFMPKNRKLTKLEVIQYVIDYICDLQEALETTPVVQISTRSPNRQPLGVLAPNTIVPPTSCSTQEAATVS